VFEKQDGPAAPARFNGAHQSRSAAANDDDVVFHARASSRQSDQIQELDPALEGNANTVQKVSGRWLSEAAECAG
jgi:hypothetical protein